MTAQVPDEAKVRGVYRITSRNLRIAVCVDGEHFIGIRQKLGAHFLDTEGFNGPGFVRLGYYKETFDPDNRFRVLSREWIPCPEPLGYVPDDVELKETGPDICVKCGRPGWWLGPPGPAPWTCDGGCDEPDVRWTHNQLLIDSLTKYEESYNTKGNNDESLWSTSTG
jgi:hypothetical protein